LIEDQPGVGKTTLANVLARLLGLSLQRIQFTSDLLPADILGVSVYKRETESFSFHPGPIFSQVVLADEVNRATPRGQSALLEAMEEQQVTIEGETRALPEPFFVIATQNPSNQIGTFPLPESQLDRFMMCLQLGYPDNKAERELLKSRDRRELLAETVEVITATDLREAQSPAKAIYVAEPLLEYLLHHLSKNGGWWWLRH
jgi:MoxR-like ATPase